MKRTGLAGLLLLVLAVPVARADTPVNVRVEGKSATLLPRTAVTLPTTAEPNTGCSGDSGASALELGTKGDWDRKPFVQTILGEKHDFTSNSDSWSFWVFKGGRYQPTATGLCDVHLLAGEELLGSYQESDDNFDPTILPLWLTDVPATAAPGVPFTVTVNKAQCSAQYCAETVRVPGAGATVTAGNVTATAGSDGRATLTLTSPGTASLRATASKSTPSASETVTVPASPAPGASPAPTPTVTPAPAPAADTRPPYSAVLGIREQQTFSRKNGPRTLKAAVDEPVAEVTLGLSRQVGRSCSVFSDTRGTFVKSRCKRHPRFVVGKDSQVSYLLPKKLAAGRYVLDVVSTDVAGNEEQLARGRNRVVFRVK